MMPDFIFQLPCHYINKNIFASEMFNRVVFV